MFRLTGCLAVLVGIGHVVIPDCSFALPIKFEHTGTGTGTIDTTGFSNADFIITAVGDTDNRTSRSWWFSINHDAASILISGVGEFQFVTGTRTFVNNSGSVGFSRASGADLFNGPTRPVLSSWDMLTSIGPISGEGRFLQWTTYSPVLTDGGTLVFNNGNSGAAFQATVIPEPSTLALLGMGAVGLLVWAWRRRKRA